MYSECVCPGAGGGHSPGFPIRSRPRQIFLADRHRFNSFSLQELKPRLFPFFLSSPPAKCVSISVHSAPSSLPCVLSDRDTGVISRRLLALSLSTQKKREEKKKKQAIAIYRLELTASAFFSWLRDCRYRQGTWRKTTKTFSRFKHTCPWILFFFLGSIHHVRLVIAPFWLLFFFALVACSYKAKVACLRFSVSSSSA